MGSPEETDLVLNVANTAVTRFLGPGLRGVVWVQGCPFHCAGCIAPEWIVQKPARLVRPAELLDELLADPEVAGLTFSGGEPMLQAAALAQLMTLARRQRPGLTLVCYTGFAWDQLQSPAALGLDPLGVAALLAETDVLIDGPYVIALDDNRGLRGSSNQGVRYLSERLSAVDFEHPPRRVEIRVAEGYAMLVGVPPTHVSASLNQAIQTARKELLD